MTDLEPPPISLGRRVLGTLACGYMAGCWTFLSLFFLGPLTPIGRELLASVAGVWELRHW